MSISFNGCWRYFMQKGFAIKPGKQEAAMYDAPFVDKANRLPTSIFPPQLVKVYEFEKAVELGLGALREKPVFLLWANKDIVFKNPERECFKATFTNLSYHSFDARHFWQDN